MDFSSGAKVRWLPSHICVAMGWPSKREQTLYHRVPVSSAMEEPEEEENKFRMDDQPVQQGGLGRCCWLGGSHTH